MVRISISCKLHTQQHHSMSLLHRIISVLEYFLENYRGKVHLHAASGKFANGAMAFWIAVWNGQLEAVKL